MNSALVSLGKECEEEDCKAPKRDRGYEDDPPCTYTHTSCESSCILCLSL